MAIQSPFNTGTAIASGAITKGAAIRISAGTDKTDVATVVTSGVVHGFAVNAADDKGVVNYFHNGSMGLAQVAAAITVTTTPLKITTSGYVTPCTTNNDVIACWPMETCASANSLIKVFISPSYYGV